MVVAECGPGWLHWVWEGGTSISNQAGKDFLDCPHFKLQVCALMRGSASFSLTAQFLLHRQLGVSKEERAGHSNIPLFPLEAAQNGTAQAIFYQYI